MNLLLAFAPFIVFALGERFAGTLPALVAAALIALVLVLRDLVTAGRSVKLLDAGTACLFTGLAAFAWHGDAHWSVIGVRLRVDAGLLLIVLLSIAVRRPFTLQYARERVPAAVWSTPEFMRANDVISAVWAVAFAVMVAAELALLYLPAMPPQAGMAAIVLALVGAFKFTGWYPQRQTAA